MGKREAQGAAGSVRSCFQPGGAACKLRSEQPRAHTNLGKLFPYASQPKHANRPPGADFCGAVYSADCRILVKGTPRGADPHFCSQLTPSAQLPRAYRGQTPGWCEPLPPTMASALGDTTDVTPVPCATTSTLAHKQAAAVFISASKSRRGRGLLELLPRGIWRPPAGKASPTISQAPNRMQPT